MATSRLIYLAAAALAASGAQAAIKDGCFDAEWNSTTDFWGTKFEAQSGLPFSATYHNTYMSVETHQNRVLTLYCTKDAPPFSVVGFDSPLIRVPVNKVEALDAFSQNLIDMLGMSTSISKVGVADTVTSTCVRGNMEDGITFASNAANAADASIADVTFWDNMSAVDSSKVLTPNNGELPPLEQAAYIKLIGIFFGLEDLASSIYESIAANYRCAAADVYLLSVHGVYPTGHPISAVRKTEAGFAVNQGVWWKVLASDAGVSLVDVSSAPALSNSEFEVSAASSDTELSQQSWGIIDVSQYDFNETVLERVDMKAWLSYTNAPTSSFAVAHNNVFLTDKAYNGNYRHNFFSRAPARPDLFLHDLINTLSPSFDPSYETTFLRAITSPDSITDQRRLRESCIAAGTELSSLKQSQISCTAPAWVEGYGSSGLVVDAYGTGSVTSDALASSPHAGTSRMKEEIIGICVGSLVGGVLVLGAAVWAGLMWRRKRRERKLRLPMLEKTVSYATSVGTEATRVGSKE